jgi:hypothetical protein
LLCSSSSNIPYFPSYSLHIAVHLNAGHENRDQSKPLATRSSIQTMAHHIISSHAIDHLTEILIPQNHVIIIHDTGFQ